MLALVVSAAKACAPLASDSVNFIDKDNTRSILLGILEQVTDTGCADTDEHFHEVRAADAEERHTCLAGYRSGEKGFTCTRRAHQQHTLGNTGSYCSELAGILEELDNLYKLLLFFICPGHILERNLLLLFII
ncbi:hypothetical protein D3C75_649790 [compost metagenome]